MSDGRIVIDVAVNGQQLDSLNKKLQQIGGETNRTLNGSFKNFAVGAAAFKIAGVAIDHLSSSIGGAVQRFDTLKKFPRTMQLMGHSAEDTARSTEKLADSIEGLPTTLDEVVGTTQQLTAITGDLKKSTDSAIALNNAFLASGSSAEDARRGLTQFVQMLSSGKVDLQSWKTLQETMPVALQKTAESFGFAGSSAQRDFYAALQSGSITFRDFQTRLIELNKGVGGFAELARSNSEGIGTSLANLSNAVKKGLANLIKDFDEMVEKVTGKTIAQHIDSMKHLINAAFKAMGVAFRTLTPLFKTAFDVISTVINVLKNGAPFILGAATAFGALKVVTAISAAMMALKTQTAVTLLGLSAAKTVIAALTGVITIAEAKMVLMTAATGALKVALAALGGPIGIAVIGIGALVGGLIALANVESESTKKLREEISELGKKTNETTKSVSDLNDEISVQRNDMKAAHADMDKYIDRVIELSQKEKLSTKEKGEMKTAIERLNGSIPDLNLQYSQLTGNLSATNEELKKLSASAQAQQRADAALENSNKLLQERAKLEEALAQTRIQAAKVENGEEHYYKKQQMLRDIAAEEDKLMTAYIANASQIAENNQILSRSYEELGNAAESGANQAQISFESLSEAQQKIVETLREQFDTVEADVTNAFERIKQNSVVSIDELIANLNANSEAALAWGENLKRAAEIGLDEGLIEQFRQAGIASAEQLQAVVDAPKEKIAEFNDSYRSAGEAARTGFTSALESAKLDLSIISMVLQSKSTLKTQIENAGFHEIGENVTQGLTQGIESGAQEAATATNGVADQVKNAFTEPMQIHSPSRLFMQYGQFLTQGLAQGLSTGQFFVLAQMLLLNTVVESQLKRMESSTKTTANNIRGSLSGMANSLYSIGQQAMAGLAAGISANSYRATAAAESVANAVTARMRSALRIHSPSRVMSDEVGRYIPEGVAAGIMGNMSRLQRAMDAMGAIRPDMGLTLSNVAQTMPNAVNFANNNTASRSGENNPVLVIENVTNLDSREIGRSTSKYVMEEHDVNRNWRLRQLGVQI